MGVPKFYRWISERYPCLSEVVKEYQVPEFDNLYLDMNGIIHNCSHPNDEDPHFRITEEQIFKDIFRYIEVLFRIIQPKKVFYMAVDGVAPRAKMNQQRGRRFRSAREAQQKMQEAERKGEQLPSEKRFDSNCITPGTKFMARLQTQLEYFVRNKITHDTMWQGIDVYLSGHQTPGEGEHKIMEFIRHQRSQDDYDANTRHCLYGLDADLLVLALCSHEPHFSLLREEIQFTRSKASKTTARAEETTFHLLHISILREYIGHEFQALQKSLKFEYDLEAIIDDWVLMGFLVGNDFVPHLPKLHINGNALTFLYECYLEVMPTLDGYLNEKGIINLERFQKYLQVVSKFDKEQFEEVYSNYKWLESKKSKTSSHQQPQKENNNNHSAETEAKSLKIIKELALKQGTITSSDADDTDDESDIFSKEFALYKRAYYQEKFQVDPTDIQVGAIAFEYILALQWISHYYYNGVQSWGWFYPYHYSPYVSDLRNIGDMRLKFKLGKPFLPFQQLLAVLPQASRESVPKKLWSLMDEETSPIGDFYPKKFSTDLNGKMNEWEAVVLIPFIDEQRLVEAITPLMTDLSTNEKQRNQNVRCKLYSHDPKHPYLFESTLPGHLDDIPACTAKEDEIATQHWIKKNYNDYTKGLLKGCNISTYFQGFPTLYHLPHSSLLKKQGVRVFQGASRGDNMILKIKHQSSDVNLNQYSALMGETIEELQEKILGKSVYVNWPHMEEAKVVAISDGKVKYIFKDAAPSQGSNNKSGGGHHHNKQNKRDLNGKERDIFKGAVREIREKNLNRRGIDISETKFLIYAQLLLGRKHVHGRWGELTLEKQWSTYVQPYALQTVINNLTVKGPTLSKMQTLTDLFPRNIDVFFLGTPHYGCQAKVVSTSLGQVTISINVPDEPDLTSVKEKKNEFSNYQPGWKFCQPLKISGYMLSRITGSIYLYYPGPTQKWNIGLNLRFSKENCGVAGYTLRHNNEWLYSDTLKPVLEDYIKKYPHVFSYLKDALSGKSELDARKMFQPEDDVSEKLAELSKYLKSLPCYGGSKVHESSNVLESAAINAIQGILTNHAQEDQKPTDVTINVKPHLLYRPLAHQGTMVPDKKAKHQILDRVVNVREGYTVPRNLRGTIIGRHIKGNAENQIMLDVFFDKEFMGGLTLGGRCPERRGYKLPACSIINLSYGERLHLTHTRPVAVVKPTHHQASLSGSDSQLASETSNAPKKILQKSTNDSGTSIASSSMESNVNNALSRHALPSSSSLVFNNQHEEQIMTASQGPKSRGRKHRKSGSERRRKNSRTATTLFPSSRTSSTLLHGTWSHHHNHHYFDDAIQESADKIQEILLQEQNEKMKLMSLEDKKEESVAGSNEKTPSQKPISKKEEGKKILNSADEGSFKPGQNKKSFKEFIPNRTAYNNNYNRGGGGGQYNTKCDELRLWCSKQRLALPIYTFHDVPTNQSMANRGGGLYCVANVRLWNNWQYQGSPQPNKQMACESAAMNAISHLMANNIMAGGQMITNNYHNIPPYSPQPGEEHGFYQPNPPPPQMFQPSYHPHHIHHNNGGQPVYNNEQPAYVHDQFRPMTPSPAAIGGMMQHPHINPTTIYHHPSQFAGMPPMPAAAALMRRSSFDLPGGPVRYGPAMVDPTQFMQSTPQPAVMFIPPNHPGQPPVMVAAAQPHPSNFYMHQRSMNPNHAAPQPKFILSDQPYLPVNAPPTTDQVDTAQEPPQSNTTQETTIPASNPPTNGE